MKLVIVESPAKAKTIEKYLGKDYKVLASYGHIRDLPSKDGSVDTKNNFALTWELSTRGKTCLTNITKELTNCDELILATDPDREGEAISWHISQCISENKKFKNIVPKRIVFHEITQKAIKEAINNPREIDQGLVDAYLTRRSLDYLVGFTLSPILWRKLPGSKSAGRVQSVALRLIVEREIEIENFISQEYWSVFSEFTNEKNENFKAKLTIFNNQKLDKFDIKNSESAHEIINSLQNHTFTVTNVEAKTQKRNPVAPFTTSTLQQEAFRKLNFSTKTTMMLAQKLYEGVKIGKDTQALITYMRTDSVNLSADAVTSIRELVKTNYGSEFIPAQPVEYKSKVKNAQEAHEAIRPIDCSIRPQDIEDKIDKDMFRLYDLIWKRTLASQMSPAIYNKMQVDISTNNGASVFRANGSAIKFHGFLKVYEEGLDEANNKDDEGMLPLLNVAEKVDVQKLTPNQHFTQPAGRFSEASLVKKLEELGIGRPSTYATIIQVLQAREYVSIVKKVFVPEFRGRVVTVFLMNFFSKYVQYDFTASLEEELDQISTNEIKSLDVLNEFWHSFSATSTEIKNITNTTVVDLITTSMFTFLKSCLLKTGLQNDSGSSTAQTKKILSDSVNTLIDIQTTTTTDSQHETKNKQQNTTRTNEHKNINKINDTDSINTDQSNETNTEQHNDINNDDIIKCDGNYIKCPSCGQGTLFLKASKFGFFLGCSQYPTCNYLKNFSSATLDRESIENEGTQFQKFEDVNLGINPATNSEIFFKKGPYGYYFQTEENNKIKRVAMPSDWDVKTKATLENALFLLTFPRTLGTFQDEILKINLGKFGPYIGFKKLFISIPRGTDLLSIELQDAEKIILNSKKYKEFIANAGEQNETENKEKDEETQTKKTTSRKKTTSSPTLESTQPKKKAVRSTVARKNKQLA